MNVDRTSQMRAVNADLKSSHFAEREDDSSREDEARLCIDPEMDVICLERCNLKAQRLD